MKQIKTLSYIANNRIPSEKAHSIYILKMCDAFASSSIDVELIVPFRFQNAQRSDDVFNDLALRNRFPVQIIMSPDFLPLESLIGSFIKPFYFFQCITFSIFVVLRAVIKSIRSLYLTSDIWVAFFLCFTMSSRTVLDIHVLPHSRIRKIILRYMLRRRLTVVTVTSGMKNTLISEFHAQSDRIFVLPNAYDDRLFNRDLDKRNARRLCNLPENIFIIGYVGRFTTMGEGKGVENLIESIRVLKDDKIMLLLVGDDEGLLPRHDDVSVMVIPHVPQSKLLPYLRSCDAVTMPFPNTPHYEKNMSPMKLFEYMASGVPVISTNLPSIREILEETDALLIKDNSPSEIAVAIRRLKNNPQVAGKLAESAFEKARQSTWQHRAELFISFISKT